MKKLFAPSLRAKGTIYGSTKPTIFAKHTPSIIEYLMLFLTSPFIL
jgi:hypothetical protein